MIPVNELRAYLLELALYCLHTQPVAMTAGDLTEAMGDASMGFGHPPEYFKTLTTPTVAGLLRTLKGQALVRQKGVTRANTRNGRQEPTFEIAGDINENYPPPTVKPAKASAGSSPSAMPLESQPAADDPYAGLTPEQLRALLRVGDELALAANDFQTRVSAIRSKAHLELARLGLGDL